MYFSNTAWHVLPYGDEAERSFPVAIKATTEPEGGFRFRACPMCGQSFSRAYVDGQGFAFPKGSTADLLQTVCGGLLVSERFAQAWQSDGMTGIERLDPVRITKVRGRAVKPDAFPYYAMTLNEPKAQLDLIQSGCIIEWKEGMEPRDAADFDSVFCLKCGKPRDAYSENSRLRHAIWAPKRIVFAIPPRDDISLISNYELYSTYFVSKRYVEFIKKHRFSNCYAVPVEEFRPDLLGFRSPPCPDICRTGSPTPPKRTKAWSHADETSIACDSGAWLLGDTADLEDEEYAVCVPATQGIWRVRFECIDSRIGALCMNVEGASEPDCWQRVGNLSIDGGMAYIRPDGLPKSYAAKLREQLTAAMETEVNSLCAHTIVGRVRQGLLFFAGYGDGDYAIYVDNPQKACCLKMAFIDPQMGQQAAESPIEV